MNERARTAVYVVFILNGFAFATWASRIPSVRDALGLLPQALGLVLLAIAAGSVLSMPLSGLVIHRFGTARTVSAMALCSALGLTTAGVGYHLGVLPVVVGLFALGVGNGTWDVAMNVEGTAVELALRRAIMSRFHAGFSVGTVSGALVGVAAIGLGIPITAHLLAGAALVALVVPIAVRSFLGGAPAPGERASRRSPLAAWTEPRTLLIGLFVFTTAFAEGTSNDWMAVATIDGYGATAALGTLTFALYLSVVTLARWFGPSLVDRHGRVGVIRAFGLVALVGLGMLVSGLSLPIAMAGAMLWALGTAMGFPGGMSAAGDEPALASGRVSVVATIGYLAFLAGPPVIGLLGEHTGTLRALAAAGGLTALGLLISGVIRERPMVAHVTEAGPGGLTEPVRPT